MTLNHTHYRAIGIVFAIIVVLCGVTLVLYPVVAQTESVEIGYDYGSDEITYNFDGDPFTYSNSYQIQNGQSPTARSDMNIPYQMFQSFTWGSNGENLYTSGYGVTTLSRCYNSGSPYDISECSEFSTYDTGEIVTDIAMQDNGEKLFVLHNDVIREYSLSDPYNLNPITPGEEYPIPTDLVYDKISFDPTGTQLYVSTLVSTGGGVQDPKIAQYNLNNPYDLSSISNTYGDSNLTTSDAPDGLAWNGDGSELFVSTGSPSATIERYSVSSNYDVNSGTFEEDITLNQEAQFTDLEFNNNGDQFFTNNHSSVAHAMDQYNSRITHTANVSISLEDSNGNDISGVSDSIDSSVGELGYSPNTHERVRVSYENEEESSINGISNTISIYGSGEIDIRNEQTGDLLSIPVNVTAFGDDGNAYVLDTSNGVIDITGLPDQSYTFIIDNPNYYSRTVYVDQLGSVPNMYLLHNDTDTATTEFTLQDRTNTYNQNSRVVIQRFIPNVNNTETIISDSFGASGLTTQLEIGVRHIICIENDQGLNCLGPFTPTEDRNVIVSPDSGNIQVETQEGWSAGASYVGESIRVRYTDNMNITNSVTVRISERGNEDNVLIDNQTYTDMQELRSEYAIPNQYNESNWIVRITTDRNGETTTLEFVVGPGQNITPPQLSDFWIEIAGIIVVLTFGLAFTALNRTVGSIVFACVGGMLYYIGLLGTATTGMLITTYLFIVIVYGIYTKTVR